MYQFRQILSYNIYGWPFKQHGFELYESTYTQIFFNKHSGKLGGDL